MVERDPYARERAESRDEFAHYRDPALERDRRIAARERDMREPIRERQPMRESTRVDDEPTYRTPYREEHIREREYVPAYPERTERVEHVERDRGGPSVMGSLMGWGVATFFTLVIAAILGALFGTPVAGELAGAQLTEAAINQFAIASVIVLLIGVFVGYFLGGYTAGRMAAYSGGLHGIGVVGWTVLFGILAALGGAALESRFNLVAAYAPTVDFGALTAPAVLTLLVTLAVMIGAAYLGGVMGERSWDTRGGYRTARYERRGRPL